MKKFTAIMVLIFVLAIGAEWFMLGNPKNGVVLWMDHKPAQSNYTLYVQTSEGSTMQVQLPAKVWQEWLEPRFVREKEDRRR